MSVNMTFIPIIEQFVSLHELFLNLCFYFGYSSDNQRMHDEVNLYVITYSVQILIQKTRNKSITIAKVHRMYKQAISQANTKQLRKTKLLDSFRQQQPTANRNNSNKIMLTDLCPQQKAKIGQLVKTLESRKIQNSILEQKIKDVDKRQKKYLDKIQQLQKTIEQLAARQQKLKQQFTILKLKEEERQRYIEHLLIQKQENDKKSQIKKKYAQVDQFALTDPIITLNQAVQASQKKKKCKQKQVQTEETGEYVENRRYPNNSKSFEKIMRGRTQSHSYSNQKYSNPRKQKGERKTVQDSAFRKGKKSDIKIDDQMHQNQQESQQRNQMNQSQQKTKEQQQYEDDEDFNELAKKWLQLKQKNMSKIKQSYHKSKQRQNSSQSKVNMNLVKNSFNIPRQFDDKNNLTQQNFENDNMLIENNESFGPKRSHMKQSVSKSKSKGRQVQADQDFDQIQLNKILKSKNFSASRLLNKRQLSEENEKRPTYDVIKADQKSNKPTPAGQPYHNMNHQLNMKNSTISNSRSYHNIDFYETDLLDIVSSINRK